MDYRNAPSIKPQQTARQMLDDGCIVPYVGTIIKAPKNCFCIYFILYDIQIQNILAFECIYLRRVILDWRIGVKHN